MGEKSRDANSGLLELDDPTALEASEGIGSGTVVPAVPTIVPKIHPRARERMVTVTDEVALEQARLASARSDAPPPMRPRAESAVEIDTGETDLDDLEHDEQVAILRSRLHPLSRTPSLACKLTELGEVLEDPQTAYVLGFVDGILPLETIVEITGVPELDTLRVLDRMVSQGVVVFVGAAS